MWKQIYQDKKKGTHQKVIHSYYERKVIDDPQIDKQLCNAWRKYKYLTSEVENYISVVQDQELQNLWNAKKIDMVGKIQAVIINADHVLTT